MERDKELAVWSILAQSVCFGVAGMVARELQRELQPLQLIALQNGCGFIVVMGIVWLTQGRLLPKGMSRENRVELLGRALVGRLLGSLLFVEACAVAPLGNVGFLSALPTNVPFAWLLKGEQSTLRQLQLLALSVVGIGFVASPSMQGNGVGVGEVCAVGSALAIGLGMVLGRDAVKETDTWSVTAWVHLVTALGAGVGALLFEGGLVLPSAGLFPMVLLAIAVSVTSSAAGAFGYAHLSASLVTAILSLEVVWAMALGYWMYGEFPTLIAVIGGAIIVWSAYRMQGVGEVGRNGTAGLPDFAKATSGQVCPACWEA